MTEKSGTRGSRKRPLEGFNNVPKILKEARRIVDVVTQTRPAAESAETIDTGQGGEEIFRPGSPEAEIKVKKSSDKKTSGAEPTEGKTAARKKPRAKTGADVTAPGAARTGGTSEARPAPKAVFPPEKFGISIVHRVPGRARVRVKRMKYNTGLANKLKERLATVPGITTVETSVVTAGAVINYNPGLMCQPAALRALQEAWQDLFPGMQTDRFVADLTGEKLL
jgi:hypothetical protein